MKKTLLLSIFFSIIIYADAQSRYVLSDGKEITDCVIRESTEKENSLRLFVWKAGEYFIYKPDEVKEYHIGKRKSYYSMPISQVDTTFLRFVQKMVDGDTKLYCYHSGQYNVYLIQNSDTTVQLNRKTFQDGLSQTLQACPEKIDDIIEYLQYDRHYLKKFIEQYNNSCNFKPLNLRCFGVFAGATGILSVNPSYYSPYTIGERMNLNFGFFLEEPINASNFSFHGELSYSGIQFKKSDEVLFLENDEDKPTSADTTLFYSFVRQHSLNLPLMIRYSMPTHKIRPFVNTGIQLSLNLTKNSYETNFLYRPNMSTPVTNVVLSDPAYSKVQPSFLLGAGVAFKLDSKKMAYIECRYSKLFDMIFSNYGADKLSLLASFSF
ncbi:MAG: hypothetical protein BGO29_12165 [Bacteroidales bacterium 36-12]|nr:MAG: hypothetical protein BGO29_12165 [Bacteroidales bacterium 36-12]